MTKPLSYFAAAIRGDRSNLRNCEIIVGEMKKYSLVLTEHTVIGASDRSIGRELSESEERHIYLRDMKWLREMNYFVADVTGESQGVGFEISIVKRRKVPAKLFRHEKVEDKSTMQSGFPPGKMLEWSLEEVLRRDGCKIPIVYYNDENIREVAEREIRTLFEK